MWIYPDSFYTFQQPLYPSHSFHVLADTVELLLIFLVILRFVNIFDIILQFECQKIIRKSTCICSEVDIAVASEAEGRRFESCQTR